MRKIEKNSVQRIAAAIVNFNFPLPYSLHNYEQHCFVVLKPLQWILMKRVVLSFVSLFFFSLSVFGEFEMAWNVTTSVSACYSFQRITEHLKVDASGEKKTLFFLLQPIPPPFFSSPQHEVKVDFNFRFKGEITVLVSSIPFFFFLPPSTL